jgi:hypothetical protein
VKMVVHQDLHFPRSRLKLRLHLLLASCSLSALRRYNRVVRGGIVTGLPIRSRCCVRDHHW